MGLLRPKLLVQGPLRQSGQRLATHHAGLRSTLWQAARGPGHILTMPAPWAPLVVAHRLGAIHHAPPLAGHHAANGYRWIMMEDPGHCRTELIALASSPLHPAQPLAAPHETQQSSLSAQVQRDGPLPAGEVTEAPKADTRGLQEHLSLSPPRQESADMLHTPGTPGLQQASS